MKINRKSLLSELQWANRFTCQSGTIPILRNLLFEASGNTLRLTGTDLEVAGVAPVHADTPGEFKVTAPVRKLIQYLQELDDEHVDITADPLRLIVSHADGRSSTNGMDAGGYPELPVPTGGEIRIRNLQEAISRTIFAISPEESRFTLNGALIDVTKEVAYMVTTDGHRMSRATLHLMGADSMCLLLPKKALIEAGRFDGECSLIVDEEAASLQWGERKVITRKLKGTFPEYWRVIPKDLPNHVMIPVKATEQAATRAQIYADDRSHAGRFSIARGVFNITASSVGNGECALTIPMTPGEITADLEIGLNLSYVLDFLRCCPDENVAFCWTDTKSSAVFTNGPDWAYVLMPMRI